MAFALWLALRGGSSDVSVRPTVKLEPMHLLKTNTEPNHATPTHAGELATHDERHIAAPVDHVDWRQHYSHRHWCYDSLLEALSAEYCRAQDRTAEARENTRGATKTLRNAI